MRSLSDTIARLGAIRTIQRRDGGAAAAGKLVEFGDFGSNPGALRALSYVPAHAPRNPPLVVVLHGCTQNAVDYDRGAGWSQLADELGFALLFPEQRRSNNLNLCFNWYEPANSRRGKGEPLSIKQMIDTMIGRHGVDASRVYVNGLSAGGAMTSVMLATYPELFAGGAIIAGLPYGAASSIPEAFDRMRGHGGPDSAGLEASVRAASPHRGPWPSLSVWHGSADHIVDSSNGEAILKQWQMVHGVSLKPDWTGEVEGYPYRLWSDADGRAVIEDYRITGMGHGTPLATIGEDGCGISGAHMLEVAISSTRHIARFWGLGDGTKAARTPVPAARVANDREPPSPPVAKSVGQAIEDALRAAGLMQ